jgi:hypothetical protein
MTLFRTATAAAAIVGAMAVASVTTPARAEWHGQGHWRHWYGPRRGWGWPAYAYYRPPPVYYAPPPVYYPPPPPVYYSPGVSFGLTIR